MGGISNFQIEAFKKIDDQDPLSNFVGVFASNYMNKFISHAAMIEDSGKFPFIIANTELVINSELTGGVYWTQNRGLTSFSYEIEGLNHFIIKDDKEIVTKILIGIEKMDRTDNKITLCKVRFNLGACKQLSKDKILSLSDTARNFFYFIQAFGNKLKVRSFVNIWMVEDRLQDLESATCGLSQIYFFPNLFNPDINSKKQGETNLNKKTVQILLNEIFSLDDKENEVKMEEYANHLGVNVQ